MVNAWLEEDHGTVLSIDHTFELKLWFKVRTVRLRGVVHSRRLTTRDHPLAPHPANPMILSGAQDPRHSSHDCFELSTLFHPVVLGERQSSFPHGF